MLAALAILPLRAIIQTFVSWAVLPSSSNTRMHGLSLKKFTDLHQGFGWLGIGERYYFSLSHFFVPRTHFLVQILVNFGGNFFLGGNLKRGMWEELWMRRYTERRSDNFRRSQDESQVDGKIVVWSHMFPCPRRRKVNKGEKYIHSRPLNYQNIKDLLSNLHVQTPGMSAPKRMLLKHLRYNSWLLSFLSPRVHIYITSENPFREMEAFQNGSVWRRSDADAAHMRKASGVIQMRQTMQIPWQINKNACIRNWTDEFTSRESHNLHTDTRWIRWPSTNDTFKRLFVALCGLRKMVRLNQRVGGA